MESEACELLPRIVQRAWDALDDPRRVVDAQEVSARVSTNQVFRLTLDDGTTLVTKVSSYGRFCDFQEDHERLHLWTEALRGGPYSHFLARAVTRDGSVYTHNEGSAWAVFYVDVTHRERLGRVLRPPQISNLAEELASFHLHCQRLRHHVPPTSKTIQSDLQELVRRLGSESWCRAFPLMSAQVDYLLGQCESLRVALERWGYSERARMPVLLDWNTGNFTVEPMGARFRFFSRWDYDWFRTDPAVFDFYFASRVVSAVGDRTVFSYQATSLLEPRFFDFLRAYHRVRPLDDDELEILPELYRFFVLNYVVKDGEHFFRASLCRRLRREVIDIQLPELDGLDFSRLRSLLASE